MKWFVYLVRCADNSLYTGITTNIKRRINQHNNKIGAKSIIGKLPVKLVYNEMFNHQQDAARREKEIKGWRREKKLILINYNSKGLALRNIVTKGR